ncbi:hypothetical protein [Streptomyces longwoodensis]|uniref:hypothetical protein n=1 Tax=Streptomyces longwoodensis TaxID=68231 RepID=UPI00386ACDE5
MSGPGAPDDERAARVFLGRVIEPGDEVAGRWVRETGAPGAVRQLLRGADEDAPTGVSERRWAGLRARADAADPARDLALADAAGLRFVCPGDAVFHLQSACCSRSCCVREGPCCGAVAPLLGGGWRYTEAR